MREGLHRYPLFVLLGVLALYHGHLLGRGALAWPDEHLYRDSLGAVAALNRLDLPEFARTLTGFGARPAEAVFRSVSATVQLALERDRGISPLSPRSLRLAAAPNVVVSLLLALVFFRVALVLFDGDESSAALATMIFALLPSSHVWIRHVVPYDGALGCWLVALYLALRLRVTRVEPITVRRGLAAAGLLIAGATIYVVGFYPLRWAGLGLAAVAFAGSVSCVAVMSRRGGETQPCVRAGLIAGFALAWYPAYYSLGPALSLIVLCSASPGVILALSRRSLRAAGLFSAAAWSVLLGFEFVARLGKVSYLASGWRLSKTITQGSFEEGFVFLPRFLGTVEGPIGVVLVVLLAAYAGQAIFRGLRRGARSAGEAGLARCLLTMAAFYFVYAIQSTILHRMAFTGRYIRFYVPFVVWAGVAGLRMLPISALKRLGVATTFLCSILSFVSFALKYREIDYPADVLYRLGIAYDDLVVENIRYEVDLIPNYNLPVKMMTSGAAYVTHPGDDRFVLVNFGIFDPNGRDLGQYAPPGNMVLLTAARHFLTFRSSVFEGYNIQKRHELLRRAYRLKVYQVQPGPVSSAGTR